MLTMQVHERLQQILHSERLQVMRLLEEGSLLKKILTGTIAREDEQGSNGSDNQIVYY